MPDADQDAIFYQPAAAAPLEDAVEEAPAAEETAEAVTDAMAELYPETVQPAEEAVEATYTRRRKADEE